MSDVWSNFRACALQAKAKFDEDAIIQLTKHSDARIRKRALKELCPCRVKDDVDAFWDRVFGAWRGRSCFRCWFCSGFLSWFCCPFPPSFLPRMLRSCGEAAATHGAAAVLSGHKKQTFCFLQRWLTMTMRMSGIRCCTLFVTVSARGAGVVG